MSDHIRILNCRPSDDRKSIIIEFIGTPLAADKPAPDPTLHADANGDMVRFQECPADQPAGDDAADTLHCLASYIHKHWQESKPFLPDSVALDQIAAIRRGEVPGVVATAQAKAAVASNSRLMDERDRIAARVAELERERDTAQAAADRNMKEWQECGLKAGDAMLARDRLAAQVKELTKDRGHVFQKNTAHYGECVVCGNGAMHPLHVAKAGEVSDV